MGTPPNRPLTPGECQRQAALYANEAAAERGGMRTALLRISEAWITIAKDIEQLPIVREINRPPMQCRIAGDPLPFAGVLWDVSEAGARLSLANPEALPAELIISLKA